MDFSFYTSLRRKYGVETPSAVYVKSKLSEADSRYYYDSIENLISKLDVRE